MNQLWLKPERGFNCEPNHSRCLILASLCAMPIKERSTNPPPEIPGGEGWLVNADAQWVAVLTYRWVPAPPPILHTRRRMLRHNAVDAWKTMLKTGWRQCSPPVR